MTCLPREDDIMVQLIWALSQQMPISCFKPDAVLNLTPFSCLGFLRALTMWVSQSSDHGQGQLC